MIKYVEKKYGDINVGECWTFSEYSYETYMKIDMLNSSVQIEGKSVGKIIPAQTYDYIVYSTGDLHQQFISDEVD